jgi:hypothetical protein
VAQTSSESRIPASKKLREFLLLRLRDAKELVDAVATQADPVIAIAEKFTDGV